MSNLLTLLEQKDWDGAREQLATMKRLGAHPEEYRKKGTNNDTPLHTPNREC